MCADTWSQTISEGVGMYLEYETEASMGGVPSITL